MILVFGAINLDLVFPVHRLPAVGQTLRSPGGWTEPGGKAVNQAIAAHRDGARVALIGAVARDAVGDDLLERLTRQGIRCGHVARLEGATGRAAIAVADDGHTAVLVDPGVNLQARADQVPDRLLRPGNTLLLQMESEPDQIARLVARARSRDVRVVLHFSPPTLIGADTLRQVDVLIGNAKELSWLAEHLGCGNSPASIQAALGVTVVGMSGVQGAEAVSSTQYLRMAAFPVDMRDTTAAADAFIGIFAVSLDRGESLSDALHRANVAAGLTVTKLGTGRSIPDRRAIDQAVLRAPRVKTTEPEMLD